VSEKKTTLDQKVVDLVDNYLKDNVNPETNVTFHLPPETLRTQIDLNLADNGCTQEELYKTIEQYLKFSVRTGHRQFFNQLWSGFAFPGFLGELFTSLTNTSMYTYEMAPVATLMEKELIKKMGGICGFENPDGLFVTGGSNGNLQAMMIARNRTLPHLKSEGFMEDPRLIAYVSEEAHYSFDKNANLLGLGSKNVHKIKTDEMGRMVPDALDRAIARDLKEKKRPFFVAATAGTTVKGAFDPIEELVSIARRHDLWFHVDGALGGSVVLSPHHRHLLRGLENADSFSWNAHKLMGLPLICSLLLIREQGLLLQTNSVSGADYIFHDEADGAYDLGTKSLQCGREADALKLWLSWKYYGKSGYAERIDRFFDLAAYAEEIVKQSPSLELMAPRSSVSVCFRYIPDDAKDVDKFNLRLREELARSGKALVNYARLGKDMILRLVISNHELTREDVSRFFENVHHTAESLT
jgi:glutamate/tyrosine decarboxylase-like PLP-dependent enzyme